jgi:hypothetical protein
MSKKLHRVSLMSLAARKEDDKARALLIGNVAKVDIGLMNRVNHEKKETKNGWPEVVIE